MKKIIIIGASGHAKVIIDIIELEGKYEIFGLVDSFKEIDSKIFNYSVIGTEKDIPKLINEHNVYGGIIAIGDNFTRMSMFQEISSYNINFKFIKAIHPSAIIGKDVKIGDGSCIMAGVVLNSDAKIGKQCIVNTKSSIGHEVKVKDFSSISPGVTIGGLTEISKCSAISIGATILEGIKIGKHTVVGASSMVNKDIGDNKLVYGIPAKEISNRNSNDKYLGVKKIKNNNSYELELYTIKSNSDKKRYTDTIEKIDDKCVFFSLEYCNYLEERILNYFVLKNNNKPLIVLPIYFSKIKNNNYSDSNVYFDATSPYGYNGPLYKSATKAELILFWEKVDEWYKQNNVITEFIRFNLNNNYKHYSGNLIPTLFNVKGDLTNFENIWDSFKQKVRNNYRKAVKNDLKAVIHDKQIGIETINIFYDIYIKTMQRNGASKDYFYSKNYFKELIKNNSENVAIILIYKDDIAISTELIIINNSFVYSHLGGTLSEYFDLRPNDFLKIETIRWALKNKKRHYILGGGRKNNDSLYNYKKSFFPKEEDVTFYTGRKIINKEIYKKLAGNFLDYNQDLDDLINNSDTYFPIYKKEVVSS